MTLLFTETSLFLLIYIDSSLSVRLRLKTLLFKAVSYLWLICELSNSLLLSRPVPGLLFTSVFPYFEKKPSYIVWLFSLACFEISSIILSTPALLRVLPHCLWMLTSSYLNSRMLSSSRLALKELKLERLKSLPLNYSMSRLTVRAF